MKFCFLPAVHHNGSTVVSSLMRCDAIDDGEHGHHVEHDSLWVPVHDLELRHSVCLARLNKSSMMLKKQLV